MESTVYADLPYFVTIRHGKRWCGYSLLWILSDHELGSDNFAWKKTDNALTRLIPNAFISLKMKRKRQFRVVVNCF